MKNVLPISFALLLASSCAIGVYPGRHHGTEVVAAVDFDGTVTYVDTVGHRIDLDYVEAGRHYTRNVYYDEGATRWNGVRYGEIRNGDRIVVHGRQEKGRWRADEVRRHD